MSARIPNEHYWLLILSFFMVLQVFPGKAFAGGVSWEQLSNKEKNVLSHLKQHWNTYPGYKQKKMQRWAKKSSSARHLIKKRFRQWSSLSASRKAKIKLELKRFKKMSPDKRRKLKAWWRWVKKLPASVRKKLKQKLPGMSKAQKRDYIRQLEKEYGSR